MWGGGCYHSPLPDAALVNGLCCHAHSATGLKLGNNDMYSAQFRYNSLEVCLLWTLYFRLELEKHHKSHQEFRNLSQSPHGTVICDSECECCFASLSLVRLWRLYFPERRTKTCPVSTWHCSPSLETSLYIS